MKERLMRGFKRAKGKKGEEGRERKEERVRERKMRREEGEREGGGCKGKVVKERLYCL